MHVMKNVLGMGCSKIMLTVRIYKYAALETQSVDSTILPDNSTNLVNFIIVVVQFTVIRVLILCASSRF